jgi:phosphatidylglycerol---prolipoprotein diacylglyceryl transferase
MYPKLFHIYGPFYINSYGTFIAIGLVLFIWLSQYALEKKNLVTSDQYSYLVSIGIITSIIGGRLLYIISAYDSFDSVWQWAEVWNGGLSILGSVIMTTVTTCYALSRMNIPLLPFADTVSIYIPLLQSISRIGCFFAGCCYGTPSTLPWAVTYVCHTIPAPLYISLHPTQLYSALLLFLIFVSLYMLSKQAFIRPGILFSGYLMAIASERFIIDFFRGDQVITLWPLIGAFSLYQGISIFLFLGGFIIFLYAILKS